MVQGQTTPTAQFISTCSTMLAIPITEMLFFSEAIFQAQRLLGCAQGVEMKHAVIKIKDNLTAKKPCDFIAMGKILIGNAEENNECCPLLNGGMNIPTIPAVGTSSVTATIGNWIQFSCLYEPIYGNISHALTKPKSNTSNNWSRIETRNIMIQENNHSFTVSNNAQGMYMYLDYKAYAFDSAGLQVIDHNYERAIQAYIKWAWIQRENMDKGYRGSKYSASSEQAAMNEFAIFKREARGNEVMNSVNETMKQQITAMWNNPLYTTSNPYSRALQIGNTIDSHGGVLPSSSFPFGTWQGVSWGNSGLFAWW